MKGLVKKLTLLLVATMVFASCVGTIDDKDAKVTKGESNGNAIFQFPGIIDVKAISDNKVEVYFFPASGDPKELTYSISYDGLSIPITVPGETLQRDYRGMLKVIVDNLNIDSEYSFTVQAFVGDTASNNTATKSARTFSNRTADFYGIAQLRNLSGEDGKTALIADWVAATREGSEVGLKKEIDPIQYEIVVLNADTRTPDDFDSDNPALDASGDRKKYFVTDKVTTATLNGLKPNTKYIARVRAVHFGYSENSDDPNYLKEQNTIYKEISTLDDSLAAIEVDLDAINIRPSDGRAGLTSLKLEWAPSSGAFSHYRVYYGPSDNSVPWSSKKDSRDQVCEGAESDNDVNTQYFCKNIDYTDNETVIADLEEYTDYDVHILICLTPECENDSYLQYNDKSPYETDPGFVDFLGISELETARNYWNLTDVYLQIPEINFNSGVIDGIAVLVKGRESGDPSVNTYLNHPDPNIPNNSNIEIYDFDIYTDEEIRISGIDINSDEQYCFSLVPYINKNGTYELDMSKASIEVCKVIRVKAPELADFNGAGIPAVDTTFDSVVLSWSTPTSGVYDRFVIFVRRDDQPFNFNEAIAGDSDYYRIEVPYGEQSYEFFGLSNGDYQFGVLTNLSSQGLFSELNTNIRPVTIE